jgi:hypothetical protein
MNVKTGLRRLGHPNGKSETDFIQAMGENPADICELEGGLRLLQWISGTFWRRTVAVIFDPNGQYVRMRFRDGRFLSDVRPLLPPLPQDVVRSTVVS